MNDYVIWYLGGYNGDCVIFWGPDRSGYTTDLSKAGRYSEEEAREIVKIRDLEKAVLFKVAEAAVRMHVTADALLASIEKHEAGLS